MYKLEHKSPDRVFGPLFSFSEDKVCSGYVGRIYNTIMKFSQAISQVRWFSFVETHISKTISVLVLRVQFNNPEDEDRDGLRNVGFYKIQQS
jgi:hypothetical protein